MKVFQAAAPDSVLPPWLQGAARSFALSCGALMGLCVPVATAQDASLAGLPFYFEANRGQLPGVAQFLARGQDFQFSIQPAEVRIALRRQSSPDLASPQDRAQLLAPLPASSSTFRMRFLDGDDHAPISGAAGMSGAVNYLIGNDPGQWHTSVPIFHRVEIQALYPGIDLVYYGNQNQLEYDFTVAPHAAPDAIRIRFEGVEQVSISPVGELVLALRGGELRQPQPALYQMVDGARQTVTGGYELTDAHTVRFAVGQYDHDLPLVIDPILSYSTYFGGTSDDMALAVAVDTNGFVYVAGETLSATFPFPIPSGAFQPSFRGGTINGDAFVAKLGNTGTNLVYLTYLGGTGNDAALDMKVDGAGNVYLTGFTDSTNFPTLNALYPKIGGLQNSQLNVFPTDAFVAELNSAGSALIYSTYLGGSAEDVAGAIAVDAGGNAYVSGYSYSSNFPTKNAFQSTLKGVNDAFVARIGPGGSPLVYSTYLGGTNTDEGEGIATDGSGFAYVSGYTSSTNFPTTANALRRLLNGSVTTTTSFDAFLAKVNTSAVGVASLVYSTLFGGTNSDSGFRVALDASGSAYVTGNSSSPDFPNTNHAAVLAAGAIGTNAANTDAFLTKFSFNTNGATMVYSVLFGGIGADVGWGVAVDPAGDAFVVGSTASKAFPVTTNNLSGFLRATNTGGYDVFVTVFNPDASALLYSAYLGGLANDFGYGIDVDPGGNAYITGRTLSLNFPTVAAFRTARSGPNDAFLAKILMDPLLTAARSGNAFQVKWRGFTPELTLETKPGFSPSPAWTPVLQPLVLSNGWSTVTLGPTNAGGVFRLRGP